MHKNFRLYSIVAGGYLSALQAGLQTAHAVADLSILKDSSHQFKGGVGEWKFQEWAQQDKTIVILSAFNSKGVADAFERLKPFAKKFSLPSVIFHEDEDSLAGAATAAAIIVPECYWNTSFKRGRTFLEDFYESYQETEGELVLEQIFIKGTVEFEFIELLKSYKLYSS